MECQLAHADAHRCRGAQGGLYSKIADRSGLSPEDPTQFRYPWGPWPAIDILQLQKNEGVEFDGFLNILLTGGMVASIECLSHWKYADTERPKPSHSHQHHRQHS